MRDTGSDAPPHIAEIVRAMAAQQAEHYRNSTFAERIVDRATSLVGRPIFVLVISLGAALWVGGNFLVTVMGRLAPDPPPFAWLDLILTLAALYIAVFILTSQRRADKLANLREQMTLELALMTEQKVTKIIRLIEELRRDSPEVRDRLDTEATQMGTQADHHTVLGKVEDGAQEKLLKPR